MLPDPFSAHVDVSGASSTTEDYTQISVNGNSVTRKNVSAGDGEPKTLKISHTVAGKGDAARDRHLVRLESYVVEDGIENPDRPVVLYAVADIPRQGVTSTQFTDMFTQFIGLLRGASGDAANAGVQSVFFDRWVGGES